MKVTIMFSLHFLLIRRNYNILTYASVCLTQSKCKIFPLVLLNTYAIFLHQERQLCSWFYTFKQDTQSLYSEIGKFPDDFISWTRYTVFGGWILCIFPVPYKNWIVPIDAAHFPWPETTTKIWKSQKINLRKKCATATIRCLVIGSQGPLNRTGSSQHNWRP